MNNYLSLYFFQDACGENPCENGGTCQRNSVGGGYACSCTIGYDGTNCGQRGKHFILVLIIIQSPIKTKDNQRQIFFLFLALDLLVISLNPEF